MAGQLVLDHSDFQKARRAAITSSVFLVIVSLLDFQSDSIKLLGLKLGVDQANIVAFGQLAVLYFLYIFGLRWFYDNAEITDKRFYATARAIDKEVRGLVEHYTAEVMRENSKIPLAEKITAMSTSAEKAKHKIVVEMNRSLARLNSELTALFVRAKRRETLVRFLLDTAPTLAILVASLWVSYVSFGLLNFGS